MDFLMLLPSGARVVFEVDGLGHYSTDGKPDPRVYAKNMSADRELKLRGYEVFRFGGAELQDPGRAREVLQRFFADLFHSFGVRDR